MYYFRVIEFFFEELKYFSICISLKRLFCYGKFCISYFFFLIKIEYIYVYYVKNFISVLY